MRRRLADILFAGSLLLAVLWTAEAFAIYNNDQDEANDEIELNNDNNENGETTIPLEYNSQLFEGDIVLHKSPNSVSYEGVRHDRRWENGLIPYQIDNSFNNYQKSMIMSAIIEIQEKTCVQFRPKQISDRDYVDIFPGEGCHANLGRAKGKGRHELSLNKGGCFISGTIRHELMHIIGFYHEQARTDRDDYVEIVYDNIPRELWDQFAKSNKNEVTDLGTEYDFGSLMHYNDRAFAIDDSRPTIVSKRGPQNFGQRVRFSDTDLYEINKLYECSVGDETTTTPRHGGRTHQPDRHRSTLREQCDNLVAERKLFFNDHCFVLSNEKAVWHDAAKKCTQINSRHRHLAFPADDTTINRLYTWLLNGNDALPLPHFVGAYQVRRVGPPHRADFGWFWFVNDEEHVHIPPLPGTEIWRRGQPNDYGGRRDERAAAIGYSGGLDDVSADLKLPYICEYHENIDFA